MRIAILLLTILTASMMVGCSGGGESSATKTEEKTFRDRDPSHMKGVPQGFAPKGPPPGAVGGPPPDFKGVK